MDPVSLAQELIRLRSESPPGEEQAVAEYLGRILADAGLEVRLDMVEPGRPNVLAILRSGETGPHLMFQGHTDVVPAGDSGNWRFPPYAGIIHEGRLYGRGAADMKGGIAAMVSAALRLAHDKTLRRGQLLLSFVIDEEICNRGVKHFIAAGIKPDWTVVGEPTGLDICAGHRGVQALRVKVTGRSVHAAQADTGVNALDKALTLLEKTQALRNQLRQRIAPLLGMADLNLTTMHAGQRVNVVPDECEMMFDRRLVPGENRSSVEQEFNCLLTSLAATDSTFQASLESTTYCPPLGVNLDSPLLRALVTAAAKLTGHKPPVRAFEACCEASLLAEATGTDSVIFGPGSIALAHNIDEYIEIAQLQTAADIYYELALLLLGKKANEEE